MMHKALIAVAALVTAAGANAAVILSSNFDGTNVNGNNPNADYQIYSPSVEGWTTNTNGIELQSNDVAGKAFSGANLVELDTTANSSMFVTLTPGRYKVSYYYSPRPGVAAGSNGIGGMLLVKLAHEQGHIGHAAPAKPQLAVQDDQQGYQGGRNNAIAHRTLNYYLRL